MNSENNLNEIIKLQEILNTLSNQKKKQWWERYMKHVIEFRGVGIPDIRKIQKNWVKEHLLHLSYEEQINIAMQCFRQKLAEDKLAGVLLLENYLYDKKPLDFMLIQYSGIFDEKLIFDWNICDWFCVRVLKNTIKLHGKKAAEKISKWKDSNNVWKARASVVTFVGLTKDTQYLELIFENCKILIKREERFAKTAVGWILHDIYKNHKESFFDFVDEYLDYFSLESLKNGIKHTPKKTQLEYIELFKSKTKPSN